MRQRTVAGLALGAALGMLGLFACGVDGVTPDCSGGQCGAATGDAAETSVSVLPETGSDAAPADAGDANTRDAADARGG